MNGPPEVTFDASSGRFVPFAAVVYDEPKRKTFRERWLSWPWKPWRSHHEPTALYLTMDGGPHLRPPYP